MEIFRTAGEIREWSRAQKRSGRSVGFVPTMGALHEGHASLLRAAKSQTDSVVLSIFVNPTQFGPSEDFAKYPRTWDADLETAHREAVQAVFAPGKNFYPDGYRTIVRVPDWNSVLEGEIRPVHFDGVTTVVAKLFHSVEPDVAVFGQKDAQQALLIRRMVKDLDFGLKLVVAPTVREPDGLALSSRNRYLSATDRARAAVLSRSLLQSTATWKTGSRNPSVILAAGREELDRDPPDHIDYFTLLDPDTLRVLDNEPIWNGAALLVIAARYGQTRLIDNQALGEVW
jgi:pantoate--beta-alanine ligase